MCTYISISNTWLREYNSIMLSMWEDMIRRLYFLVRISECAFYFNAFIIFQNASLPRKKSVLRKDFLLRHLKKHGIHL